MLHFILLLVEYKVYFRVFNFGLYSLKTKIYWQESNLRFFRVHGVTVWFSLGAPFALSTPKFSVFFNVLLIGLLIEEDSFKASYGVW